MKRILSWVLAFALMAGIFPSTIPQAAAQAASNTPVWKVAWIRVPEVKVQVGSELLAVTDPATYTQDFIDCADLFEWYIERYTNQAVDVQIEYIVAEEAPTFTSRNSSYIAIDTEITSSAASHIKMKNVTKDTYDVDIEQYDSLMVFWPFGGDANYNNPPGHEQASAWAGPNGEIYTDNSTFWWGGTPNTDLCRWTFTHTAIHEFLHLTEFWFRDELRFLLPYSFPDAADPNAVHNSHRYGYLKGKDMREGNSLWANAGPEDRFWFEDWLSCNVPDPRSPSRMLGIPPEAWNYTSTNGKRPASVGSVIVPSRNKGDTDYSVNSGSIDLTTETITLPDAYSVAAYSLDGGTKWKKGALPEGTKFQKLLDKGMTLWVTDKWNAKDIKEDGKVIDKKGVAKDAAVIQFAKINARPKTNTEKLKPYYLSDTWEPRKAGTTATSTAYVWAETTNKKTPDGEWQNLPAGGFAMLTGKAKTTYLFRTPASVSGSTYTPASKTFKLTPINYGKAPNYKVKTDTKTKKQTIKLKAGDCYQLGDNPLVKVTAAKELDVTKLSGTLAVWKGETGKKSRSEKQTLELTGSEETVTASQSILTPEVSPITITEPEIVEPTTPILEDNVISDEPPED